MVPVFAICSADPQVKALLLSPAGELKFYQFGQAEAGVAYPYAVWQQIGGVPQNYMSGRTDMDAVSIQIDVYAKTSDDAEAVAEALRSAIEPHAYITRLGGTSRDPETGSYRYSFDVDWRVER